MRASQPAWRVRFNRLTFAWVQNRSLLIAAFTCLTKRRIRLPFLLMCLHLNKAAVRFLQTLCQTHCLVLLVLCVHWLCLFYLGIYTGPIHWLYILVMSVCDLKAWFVLSLLCFFPSGPHLGYLQSLYCQACTFTSCHQNACLTFPVSDHFIGHSTNLHRFIFLFIQSIIVMFILVNSVGFSIMPNMKTPYPDTTLCV